jgi:hypothetical protein
MPADLPQDDIPTERALGRLEGRVGALEDRVGRHESTMAARLASIEDKLDAVADAIARGYGGLKIVHWFIGCALAVGGYVAAHFWPGGR